MYNLPYFKENDPVAVREFIDQHPFAFIAGCSADNKPVATQIPVFLEERNGRLYLSGHLMRQTDHHLAFLHHPDVLCVFTGHHSYVSATWYDNPLQASTWNYMSVHVRGKLKYLGEKELIEVLRKTTLHFEGNNASSSTVYDNLPEDYRNRLMKAIVAFEVEVESMENVFKLSQNRDEKSYANIIERLKKTNPDGRTIADEMEKRKVKVFPPVKN